MKNFLRPSTEATQQIGPEGPCCIGLDQWCSGGAVRSRTGLTGFAIRGITALLPRQKITFLRQKREANASLFLEIGAGKESRTLDLNLGKVALYQLSYSRIYRSFTLYNVSCDGVYCSAIFRGCQHFFINASTDRRWPHPQPIFLPPMPPRQPPLHHSKEPVCAPKQLPAPCRSI